MTKPKMVYVYRNLKHGRKARPLYSIMRNGRVIARRHRVLLSNVSFVVREAGRQKVLSTGRKNVHAFAKGYLTGSKGAFGIDANGKSFGMHVRYSPSVGHFYLESGLGYRIPVTSAGAVLLNEHGLSGCYLT